MSVNHSTINDLMPLMMPARNELAAFDAWVEEKAALIAKYDCTEEELDEALDAWLDAAKESENSQYDAWGEW